MRILLQRVTEARVAVNDETIGQIDAGILLLVGFGKSDGETTDDQLVRAANKLVNLRIFPNEAGKLDHSLIDISGQILAVPQFTLYGSAEKGRRPDFTNALTPDQASAFFDHFVMFLKQSHDSGTETGQFGADMQVLLVNDGPFTMMLEF